VLHGNDHVISGLKLPGKLPTGTVSGYEEALYFGLFGYISTAYIHDVTVRVANTYENRAAYSSATVGTINEQPSFGVLAGLSRGSRIVNVHIEADTDSAATTGLYVSGPVSAPDGKTHIGGVVGRGFDTFLIDSTSSIPVNVDGKGSEIVGGMAGGMTGEIRGAEVTGQITVVNDGGYTSIAAGICTGPSLDASQTGTTLMQDCKVKISALTLTITGTYTQGTPSATVAGIGYGSIADCTVDIYEIKIASNSSGTRNFYAGGILAGTSNNNSLYSVERSRVRFDKLEVTAGEGLPYSSVYVGGIAAQMANSSTAKVSDCVVEGDGEISVNLPYTGSGSNGTGTGILNVGGLVGSGNVSHSSIPGAFKINITTGTYQGIYAGGLTGNGAAEYSFIGTAAKPAELKVTKTNTALVTYNIASIGGISGQASPAAQAGGTPPIPFQYNYAFCDVSLITTGATTTKFAAQSVGGLAGFIQSYNGLFTESFAAGSVTLTNNYAGIETTPVVRVGGIAGSANPAATREITKCAALNSSVVLNGSNTATLDIKTWRRISQPADYEENYMNTVFTNNIAMIGGTPPSGYTPTDDADGWDGLAVTEITADIFFGTEDGQLGWNRDVWNWDAASGYPVLK
jgi:hypothetical protein